ncbi:MAG: hypothetical protein R8M11_02450 [Gallionella sp.]
MSTQTYTVTSPIRHNGNHYAQGDSIELEQIEAQALLVGNAISAGHKTAPPDPGIAVTPLSITLLPNHEQRLHVIMDAIGKLDKNNPEYWMPSGKPQLSAIEAITGFTPAGKERDAAWQQLNAA